jgi:hypothetical protein
MSDWASGHAGDRTGQVDRLRQYLRHNQVIAEILQAAPSLTMANWYLGAGCIAQTVWNFLHGFAPTFGIKDYDMVYHDASDLSLQAQTRYRRRVSEFFAHLHAAVEVHNEARVHLWSPSSLATKSRPTNPWKQRSTPGRRRRPAWASEAQAPGACVSTPRLD